MENQNKEFPFNFDLDKIREYINYLLDKNKQKKALKVLRKIEDKWVRNRKEIESRKYEFPHILEYLGNDSLIHHLLSEDENGSTKVESGVTEDENGIIWVTEDENGIIEPENGTTYIDEFFLLKLNEMITQVREFTGEQKELFDGKPSNDSRSEVGVGNTNKFNQMPLSEVIAFFHVLKSQKNDNHQGETWLTSENFDLFIRRSFEKEPGLDKPKIRLGKKQGGKGAIIKLFHGFYTKCLVEHYTERNTMKKFYDLLVDSFDTNKFDDNYTNFKSSISKYIWNNTTKE